MTVHRLQLPVSKTQIQNLRINDLIYLNGTVITARDQAHKRALKWHQQGKTLPVNLEGLAVFHCGPVMKKQDSAWIVIAAGPTTSTRMEPYEAEFIEAFKPRMIIGKGGMGSKTTQAMAAFGAVYCAFPGGAAVLAAAAIKRVRGAEWLDLGIPEAMWIFEVEEFGPLVVGIDTYGQNVYAKVAEKIEANKQEIYHKLGL